MMRRGTVDGGPGEPPTTPQPPPPTPQPQPSASANAPTPTTAADDEQLDAHEPREALHPAAAAATAPVHTVAMPRAAALPRPRQPATSCSSTRPCCNVRAVRPYIPDSRIRWEDMDLDDDAGDGHHVSAKRAWSCGGDFADPRLNDELRRFLYRDAVVLALCVTVAVSSAVRCFIALEERGDEWDLQFLSSALFFLACVSAVVLEIVAGRCFRPNDGRASMIRAFLPSLYVGSSVFYQFVRLRITIQNCGDHGAIYGNGTAASVNASLAAAAIADRQQYCIDRIDPWVISIACAGVPILRLMPQQGVPLLLLLVVGFLTGYALRPSTDEVEYVDHRSAIVANAAFQIVALATCCVYCVRLHATGRERFLAAAAAERARRLAVREMSEVDVLLQRALPEAVLKRVAAVGGAVDVIDESQLVSVLRSSLVRVSSACRRHKDGDARAYVTLLHALMSAFDGHLKGVPGVEKVKTVGDAYWAIAGLPTAVPCHASVICRFALMMQVTAANVSAELIPGEEPLGLRVGVHSGPASASILGTQRLCYEPLGEACDGAEEAEKKCSAGAVCVTERAKHRLALEASEFGSAVDSETLTATAEEVDESLLPHGVTRREQNGQLYTLFLFPPMAAIAAAASKPRLSALEERSRDHVGPTSSYRPSAGQWGGAIVDQSTVRSVAVTSALAIATTMSAAAMVEMEAQKDALERRMHFVMQRAAENERRARRRHRVQRRGNAGGGGGAAKSNKDKFKEDATHGHGGETGDDDQHGIDVAAATLEHAARFDDPEQGPFARATKVPLVYTFADDAAEAGYIEYIRAATTTLRRDVRIGTALLFFVVVVSHAATGGSAIATGILSLSFLVAAANAALLVLDVAAKSDTVLPYVAFFLMLAGCYLADGNVVGNDTFWIFPVQTTLVDFTVYTLSPLTRSGLNTVFNVAAFGKLLVLGKGDVRNNGIMAVSGLVSLPFLKALVESFTRRAFVERRLAEALAMQELTAKAAQTAMLENVVPRHAIAPLRLWLTQNLASDVAVVHELRDVVVAYVHLRAFAAAEPQPPPPPSAKDDHRKPIPTLDTARSISPLHWLLEAHKAADGLLDRCVYVTKVKTVGDSLILAGPFGHAAEAARAAKVAATPPMSEAGRSLESGDANSSAGIFGGGFEASSPSASAATAAAPQQQPNTAAMRTLADVAFVIKSLVRLGVRVHAGVHFGTIVGAVLGTERLSYDILGETVNMARRVAAGLPDPASRIAAAAAQGDVQRGGLTSPGPVASAATTTPGSLVGGGDDIIDPLSPPGFALLGPLARTSLQPPTAAIGGSDDDGDDDDDYPQQKRSASAAPASTNAAGAVDLCRNGSSLGLTVAMMLAVAPTSLAAAAAGSEPTDLGSGTAPPLYRLRAKTVSLPTAQLISDATDSSRVGDAPTARGATTTTARLTAHHHQHAVPMSPSGAYTLDGGGSGEEDDTRSAHNRSRRRGRTALLQLKFNPKVYTGVAALGATPGGDGRLTPNPPLRPRTAAADERPPVQIFVVDVVDETEDGGGGSMPSSLATSLRR